MQQVFSWEKSVFPAWETLLTMLIMLAAHFEKSTEYSGEWKQRRQTNVMSSIDIRDMVDSSLVAHLTLGWHLGRGGIMSAHIVGNVFLLLVFRKINSQSLEDTQVGY